VVVVDDGIATGGTVRAALLVARAEGARRVVLAVPVAPPDVIDALRSEADDIVCLATPTPFYAIGEWYRDFSQVPDERVSALLAEAASRPTVATDEATAAADPPPHPRDDDVEIRVRDASHTGHLTVPAGAVGLVLFAHGSGSSRHSPRNQFVARSLNANRVATLLFDLLSPHEELERANVFDIELLGERLLAATSWARSELAGLPIGFFGASTGAGAALWAAAAPGADIAAVVSRGGRPDLAGAPRLAAVRAPTLLIVGGRDDVVLDLNREAARHLGCEHRLDVVPGATHLFEEPGTLETVAALAGDWFRAHFSDRGIRPDRGSRPDRDEPPKR
jgi:putative phosphoribosyl transferase